MLPPLSKRTSATVERFPTFDRDGMPAFLVVIKRAFRLAYERSGAIRLEPEAECEIRAVDEPWPDDKTGMSVKFPNDVAPAKVATDVLVAGSAVPGSGDNATWSDVMVRVGPVETSLRVFGVRIWYRAASGVRLSPPAPFDRVPLRWDFAFGGMDPESEDPASAVDWRNPIGRGIAGDPKSLDGKDGPQIEDPGSLIEDHRSRPAPAGVAPIGPMFEPRKSFRGTYDDAWSTERMPLPPVDQDARFHQVASTRMISPGFLRGDEPVALLNVHRPGAQKFDLPRSVFAIEARRGSQTDALRPVLDTVLLCVDDERVELTWRALVRPPTTQERIDAISVFEKQVRA